MGATFASHPIAVWAHLLSDESSCSSNVGGLEYLHQQLRNPLSSSEAFHLFQQGQSSSSNAPAVLHPSWEVHDLDYSFGQQYMMDPLPTVLSPTRPDLYGLQWNGPGELFESSNIFNQQQHGPQQHGPQQHGPQQQHCSDHQEPSVTHIVPSSGNVNPLHESPEVRREAKRPSAGVASALNQRDLAKEMTSSPTSSSSRSDPSKKPRLDQAAPSVPIKGQPVRKEKLGGRVAALQKLVSPFGKTDTASVLQESISYIKFLQDQVQLLSTPYMKPTVKSGSINLHNLQELGSKPNWPSKNVHGTDDGRQDLQSRGLCLVPTSSTLLVANDNGADFWTPAISGGCR